MVAAGNLRIRETAAGNPGLREPLVLVWVRRPNDGDQQRNRGDRVPESHEIKDVRRKWTAVIRHDPERPEKGQGREDYRPHRMPRWNGHVHGLERRTPSVCSR